MDKTDPPKIDKWSLIAPELRPVLESFPTLKLDDSSIGRVQTATRGYVPPAAPLTPEQAAVRQEERLIPGPPGAPDVRVLIYSPPEGRPGPWPIYLQLHGGGFVGGAPEGSEAANRAVCADLDCLVVSVDYRLAPQTRFPGAVEDAYAALAWVRAEAQALGADPARLAIGGSSAGGGHAAMLALHARDRGETQIRLQVLEAPMIDDRTGAHGARHPFNGRYTWTEKTNQFGWRALLGVEPGGADAPAGAVPARAEDLSGLPSTLIIVGALDLFLDENLDYARRLARAGVPVELHVIPGAFHGFATLGAGTPQAQALARYRREALARAFG
jgi:acetyl esterase/lipase